MGLEVEVGAAWVDGIVLEVDFGDSGICGGGLKTGRRLPSAEERVVVESTLTHQ